MSQSDLQKTAIAGALICGAFHGALSPVSILFRPMAAKYYTHFLTAGAKPKRAPDSGEWSGVVELRSPLEQGGGTRELKALLAQSFDLDSEDIKILHWARLH
jgi:hypothetical protein